MADIKFEIKESIGLISETSKGWTREINLVAWNNYPPKYDIRDWDPDHKMMSKGITFNEEEIKKLRDLLNDLDL